MSLAHDAVLAWVVLTGRQRPFRSAAALDRDVARRPAGPGSQPGPTAGVSIAVRQEPLGPVVRLVPPRSRGSFLALHGGAYISAAAPQHWTFWRRLALATGRTAVAPLYPLAPEGTASAVVPWIADLAEREGGAPMVGDSAGGGLALAAALLLRERGLTPPLILSAPWLDGTMEHPWLLGRDPWLAAPGLRRAADLWRGELPVEHPFVSPLLADLRGLGPITAASGTRDVLHEDAVRLEQRSPDPVRMLTGEGLLHNYPLLPIPEARHALRAFAEALGRAAP